jgi:hypothetical protein
MASYAVIKDNIVVNIVKVDNTVITVDGKEKAERGVQFLENVIGKDNNYVKFDFNNAEYTAGVGFTYNENTNTFLCPKPYPSWIFNEEQNDWESPIPKPKEGVLWDEEKQQWYTPE